MAAAAFAWSASAAWAQSTAAPADPFEYTLANGLRIVVKQDRRAPTVVQMVWYRAGSIDEFNGTTGVAHVLEHMMFKGTKSVGPGQFSKQVAALGGHENAFTNTDYTAYFQRVEKSQLPEVMRLEADRMENLMLSEEEFSKEIKVVMEERRMRTEDSPSGRLWEQLMATAFTAAPQHHPVIGWMDDLMNMRYTDARDWYQRWYAPNNAVMVIAGDVDPQEVNRLAERYYGRIKPHELPVRKPQIEPEQRGARRVTVKAPAENPSVVLAFKAPRLSNVDSDDDAYALEVLEAVLDGHANARLPRNLVREGRLADDVDASYSPIGRSQALFVLSGTPAKGRTAAQMEADLRAQVALVAKEGVSEQELKRVKAQLVASQIYKRDSVMGQAMEIGVAEMSGVSWRQLDRMLDRMAAVSAEQVKAVAAKYFQDDAMTVAELSPLPLDKKTRAPEAGR
ncbi:MAG: insulinase family protein [Candidatus Protistobacter heckmanni]|nr:insulinase family protein [Candidatus Protistobacter heckmanni]